MLCSMSKLLLYKQDMGEAEVDFPFRVSPSEQAIIENDPDPPCSIVLVGRSGTGKTTCAVFRMWSRYLTFRARATEPFRQVSMSATDIDIRFAAMHAVDTPLFCLL